MYNCDGYSVDSTNDKAGWDDFCGIKRLWEPQGAMFASAHALEIVGINL